MSPFFIVVKPSVVEADVVLLDERFKALVVMMGITPVETRGEDVDEVLKRRKSSDENAHCREVE